MEKFSVVPEVFYDLIARFAAGAVFLLGLALVFPNHCGELLNLFRPKAGEAPSMTAVIPLFSFLAWFTGFLLSVASSYFMAALPGGFAPIESSLSDVPMNRIEERSVIVRLLIERTFGLAANLPAFFRRGNKKDRLKGIWKPPRALIQRFLGKGHYRMRPEVIKEIRDRIKILFKMDYKQLPYMLCFDFARAQGGSHASAVLKASAESTCFRSLILGSVILIVVAWFHRAFWTWWYFIPLWSISVAGASHYRTQAVERMLLGLLLTEHNRSAFPPGSER